MNSCLSIAGSDCSGGAGIQADIKTFCAHGCFGMSVITSVVAENTSRVISVADVDPEIIRDQMDAIFEDIKVDTVKIGMLSNTQTIQAVAGKVSQYRPEIVVVDPVMVAKGGHALMDPGALDALKTKIIPLATLLTPNIPEASVIAGMEIKTIEDMKTAAGRIYRRGAKNVLIKGGHLEGDPIDILFDGERFFTYTGQRIKTKNTHGTGCTLSSAITANLANGVNLCDAVQKAKTYVTNAIRYGLEIGKGHGPTNHFYAFYK